MVAELVAVKQAPQSVDHNDGDHETKLRGLRGRIIHVSQRHWMDIVKNAVQGPMGQFVRLLSGSCVPCECSYPLSITTTLSSISTPPLHRMPLSGFVVRLGFRQDDH